MAARSKNPKSAQAVFSPIPTSNVPCIDIMARMHDFPVYVREKMCERFDWSYAKYYRKVGGSMLMSPAEQRYFIVLVTQAFKKYHTYMLQQYVTATDQRKFYRVHKK